ncbi:hypothetical protein MN608_02518 [Microdochium nivale]|nr:hypothetical protein MN608_02518 [Microdochium nivale]
MPFARAYAPPLAAHNVSKPDFLAFVDALNLVVRPHPAVTIAEFAAMVVGVVPHDAAEAAGSAVEALALATHAALVHRDKRRFLAVLNKEYFHPRALHVKVIGNKRLRAEHGLGRKDAMVLPLTEDTLDQSPQDRCLRFMEVKGFSGVLEFEGIPQVATFVLPRRTQASRSQEEAAGIAVEEGSHGPGPTQQGKVSDLPAPNKPPLAQRLATWRIKHLIARAEREAKVQRRRAWKRHREKGKPLKEPSWGERSRVNQLDWLFVQNLDDWEAQRRAKEDKLREVQAVRRRRRAERTAGLGGVLTWKKTVR